MLTLVLASALFAGVALSAPAAPQWRFDLKAQTSGIVALEAIVISPTLVVWFDRASDDPLQINNHSAWGALWNLETSTVQPLDVITNSFCASGALLSNGSMVSLGGDPSLFPGNAGIHPDGNMGLRIFEPCASPSGEGCTLFEDPATLHLSRRRWYPSSIRIFDGSLFIAGGTTNPTPFFNVEPENSFEFFPPKDGGVPRPSKFLEAALPANLFPRIFALPDGRIFMVAGNKTAIYDIEKNTETFLPDIPNGVHVTNPADGSAILLPLSPPNFVPEVLVCGGIVIDTTKASEELSSQDPATTQCSRMVVTPAGIRRGWVVEHMLEPRIMPELVHVPNGQVLITNGGRTGYAAIASVGQPVGNSNADHAVLTPSLYTPDAPLGRRISNVGMPTSPVARMYHSSVTLTPQGNFLIAGSNPNNNTTLVGPGVKFPSEFRVQTLDPPFMFVDRPVISSVPSKLAFGRTFTVPITVPRNLAAREIQVSLMDLGFSSHAFHSGARLVFMDARISRDRRSLTFTTPPNGRVFPPGPAFVFLTIDDVTSESVMIMMGSGRAPPTLE
ncbi:hypothetical protein AURDEDRAFT_199565 [Auricularia subglabra TFB-10046 SS5]|nr:hypothetical protein AURDEDRAFT_199565 [Auricularia subglabra TFB-10046 SS5]